MDRKVSKPLGICPANIQKTFPFQSPALVWTLLAIPPGAPIPLEPKVYNSR